MSKKGFAENWHLEHSIVPVEYKVVVLPDKVEETIGEGVLHKPETSREKEQWGQEKGTLVAVSDMAFSDWKGTHPKVGDRVYYTKYAGIQTEEKGPNGVKYRIFNDKELCAILK